MLVPPEVAAGAGPVLNQVGDDGVVDGEGCALVGGVVVVAPLKRDGVGPRAVQGEDVVRDMVMVARAVEVGVVFLAAVRSVKCAWRTREAKPTARSSCSNSEAFFAAASVCGTRYSPVLAGTMCMV